MAVGDEPPEHGEQQPGEHEAGEEGEQGVAPSPVQDRHEHVLVWGGALGHVASRGRKYVTSNIANNCHQDNEPKYFALQITDTDGVGTKHCIGIPIDTI